MRLPYDVDHLVRKWTRAIRTRDRSLDELRAKYTDEHSRFLRVSGVDVHVHDEGTGPALLMIHGTASSLHSWDGWARELVKDYRVVRFDILGAGLTGPEPHDDYRVERQVEVAFGIAELLGLSHIVVIGHSLGGQIALHFAVRHASLVRALVLVAAGGFHRPAPGFFGLYRAPVLGALAQELLPRLGIGYALASSYGNPLRVTRESVIRHHELMLREGNRRALGRMIAVPPNYEETERLLGALTVPTLLLWGTRDRLTPMSQARRFQKLLPHAELAAHAGLGHVPHEEDAPATLSSLRSFLAGLE